MLDRTKKSVHLRLIDKARHDYYRNQQAGNNRGDALIHPKSRDSSVTTEEVDSITAFEPKLSYNSKTFIRQSLRSKVKGGITTNIGNHLDIKINNLRDLVASGDLSLADLRRCRQSSSTALQEDNIIDGSKGGRNDATAFPDSYNNIQFTALHQSVKKKITILINSLQYLNKVQQLAYELDKYSDFTGPAQMNAIIKIQRWTRHLRLKYTFFHILKYRRIVVGFIKKWVVPYTKKIYRMKSADRIKVFFKDCFEVGRFRMSMKIFLFRVVKVQRVIRSYLVCKNARLHTFMLLLKSKYRQIYKKDKEMLKCLDYLIATKANLLNNKAVKIIRARYMKSRYSYKISRKDGLFNSFDDDMKPADVKEYLERILEKGDENEVLPPQCCSAKDGMPVFSLYSSRLLDSLLHDIIISNIPASKEYYHQLVIDMEQKRTLKQLEEARERGEGTAFQLKLIEQRRQWEVNPKIIFEEGVKELHTFRSLFK